MHCAVAGTHDIKVLSIHRCVRRSHVVFIYNDLLHQTATATDAARHLISAIFIIFFYFVTLATMCVTWLAGRSIEIWFTDRSRYLKLEKRNALECFPELGGGVCAFEFPIHDVDSCKHPVGASLWKNQFSASTTTALLCSARSFHFSSDTQH